MFRATNIVKNSERMKYVCSGYGIAFHDAGWWSFGDYLARNVGSFCANNSSSSHTDNRKNNYIVSGEGLMMKLMATLVQGRKRLA